jgi:hypothetical protein
MAASNQRRSFGWIVWVPIVVLAPYLFLLLLNSESFPPHWYERRAQRQRLNERVQMAGGWDAIRRACVGLAEQNTNGFHSHWHDTNLPPAIGALRPLMVQYSSQHGCVSMRIFGIHSTGGHSTPYFGLEVDTSTNGIGYKHGSGYDNGGVIGNYHSVAVQVADGIYEIY